MLALYPEADRPGFIPCPEDRRREAKYAERRRIEQQNREAIHGGNRVYDDSAYRLQKVIARMINSTGENHA